MAVRRIRASRSTEAHHDFFISMTDMMVGMIFLFIIMLMFFALKLDRSATQSANLVANLATTEEVRANILRDLKDDMARQGVSLLINRHQGVLSLSENILFDKGKAELSRRGEDVVSLLAQSIYSNLSCYTVMSDGSPVLDCPVTPHSIEAVLIEGHTDSDGADINNWNLSVKRSFNAYQAMMAANPNLPRLLNRNGQSIFSIAGYGKQRPNYPNDTDDNKHKNRRIDIRVIMVPPAANDIRTTP